MGSISEVQNLLLIPEGTYILSCFVFLTWRDGVLLKNHHDFKIVNIHPHNSISTCLLNKREQARITKEELIVNITSTRHTLRSKHGNSPSYSSYNKILCYSCDYYYHKFTLCAPQDQNTAHQLGCPYTSLKPRPWT